ncbi:MAG: TRAP transporter substrate-binding protein [Xanthobacteraceae bacterium]|nr:TRAP transporter substrate-binding protein [Xanthobacteraceae bacterium]MBX3534609.1 TRAP transporter substrate-binding protein [Xanthobacteraceae bacterium]MBX3549899.1 TRAP transporter substrate-binding protein [Xanthobacteraceae bacterium]MCW5675636.1 TRAP transporter substrate-binding protein [Xanthobacteraceae bacterium]MCW5676319.1 TRAP transporter substrate-binding protein [Xanthobacteraceae bacterium]
MDEKKLFGPHQTRRQFMSLASRFGGSAATLAWFGAPLGVSLLEVTKAYAQTEAEKKSKADHIILTGITENPKRWPNGKLSTEQSNLTGVIQWKENIEKHTNGKVYVDLQYGGSLGNQIDMPKKLQQGTLQGAHGSTQNAAASASVWNVIDFPYHVGPVENFWRLVFSKEFNDVVRKKSEQQGLVMTVIFPQVRWMEYRKGLGREVRRPEDIKGLKIRVTGSKLEQTAFRILPANPTPVAWGETYNALKEGAVDGLHVGPGPIADVNISEVIGQLVDTEFMYNSDAMYLSARWYRALPAAIQEQIMEACYDTQVFQHKVYESYLRDQWGIRADSPPDSIWQKLKPQFIYLNTQELDAWKEYLSYGRNKAIYDPLIAQFGKKEYETTGKVANEKSPVSPRRWWKA